ncbi:MAG: hypothetical protein RLZZ241_1552 [Bacteroidota bacterium]
MNRLSRLLAVLFACCLLLALSQCGRRGSPTGGPKDTTPPVLITAEPPIGTTQFKAERVRLYFDEYIKLQNTDKQLIISPPLKYPAEITPMGGASKYVEVKFSDTLLENTTYSINFGQSVTDNNEGNPYNFLNYVFSTGDKVDSLSLSGVVADAFNLKPDAFISVMLYRIDSVYTDSTVYKSPPYYLTNTLDSAVIFKLNNLKAGKYKLIALKDDAKNNLFNPSADKIGFVQDTISLPTEETYVLRLFKESPPYSARPPSFSASNRILFGYSGGKAPEISLLTPKPDSVTTKITPIYGKDSLNFWFTAWKTDSLQFAVKAPEQLKRVDTFTVKPLKIKADSLLLSWNIRNEAVPIDSIYLSSSLPLVSLDTAFISMMDQDSLKVSVGVKLDTLNSRVFFDFKKEPEQSYSLEMLPGALTDFFGGINDSIALKWRIRGASEFGILKFSIDGAVEFPVLVELTDSRSNLIVSKIVNSKDVISFNWLKPETYRIRVIFDKNRNGKWDSGNFLEQRQPERVLHYPAPIEIRANWEKVETFTIQD